MELALTDAPVRIGLAGLPGAVVGFERELRGGRGDELPEVTDLVVARPA
jgi:hypothetical protein